MTLRRSDEELELLRRVTSSEDFFHSVLVEDTLQDWSLGKEFGELLIRLMPDSALGHLVVARACRHLKCSQTAVGALARCRTIITSGKAIKGEEELLLPVLEAEERMCCSGD